VRDVHLCGRLACFVFCQVLCLAAAGRPSAGQDKAGERPNADSELNAERLGLMKRMADRYELSRGADGKIPLERVSEPVLRWTNPVRGASDGCLFLWTDGDRPAAILSIYPSFGSNATQWDHEFQSLSGAVLVARRARAPVWFPEKPGIEWKFLTDSGSPAESAPRRLSQIRSLAAKFSCTVTVRGDKTALRLLTTPIYRYGDPKSEVIDGALLAFAQGTDPELLLLLEARAAGERREWHYALARLTMWELEARFGDRAVWSAREDRNTDPKRPYLTIDRQSAD